jgi:hypothetical protein
MPRKIFQCPPLKPQRKFPLPHSEPSETDQITYPAPVLTATARPTRGGWIRVQRSLDELWIECPNPGLIAVFKYYLIAPLILLISAIFCLIRFRATFNSLPKLFQTFSLLDLADLSPNALLTLGLLPVILIIIVAPIALIVSSSCLFSPVLIHFDQNRLLVYKRCFGIQLKLATQSISKIEKILTRTIGRVGRTAYRGVTIQTSEMDYSFGIGLSRDDCNWLATEIQNWLQLQ